VPNCTSSAACATKSLRAKEMFLTSFENHRSETEYPSRNTAPERLGRRCGPDRERGALKLS